LFVGVSVIAVSLGITGTAAFAGLPSSAAHLTVTGATTSGLNAHLKPAASIAGTITAADGSFIASAYSDFSNGTFSFKNLSPKTSGPSTGYVVCFDGRHNFSAPSGYLPQCFNGVNWNGS
jgi:hypothetical protein